MKRRSEEAEAFRLKRLREVMCRPRSETWKQNQAAGIRKAYADGRAKINWSALRKAQRTAAERNRGKPLSLERRRRISEALKGKKFSKDRVERMRERAKGRRPPESCFSPAARAKAIETRRRNATLTPSRQTLEKAWAANRGRKQSDEEIKRRQKANTGKIRDILSQPHCAKGPKHVRAMIGALRSPENIVYHFKNLIHFVREHQDLFHAEDVKWTGSQSRPRELKCRASKGLSGLYEKRSPRGSWKGWTIAATNLVSGPGVDLLHRQFQERRDQIK